MQRRILTKDYATHTIDELSPHLIDFALVANSAQAQSGKPYTGLCNGEDVLLVSGTACISPENAGSARSMATNSKGAITSEGDLTEGRTGISSGRGSGPARGQVRTCEM